MASNAAANLVVNGDFETFSGAASQIQSSNNPNGAVLPGWTNAGYTFLFTPGSADTTGSTSQEFGNQLTLWGPGAGGGGVRNGLTATSPTGGNFIGVDGAFQQGALSQSISGLQVGQNYALTFWWAAGQQQGYTGSNSDSWGVTFGGQSFTTATVNNPSEGFQPWQKQVFIFAATSATQTLSFLAQGTPAGTPPFSLLDGISLVAAPEPNTWPVLATALAGLAVLGRWTARRRRRPAGA